MTNYVSGVFSAVTLPLFSVRVALSAAQLSMLREGIDWRRPVKTWAPELAAIKIKDQIQVESLPGEAIKR